MISSWTVGGAFSVANGSKAERGRAVVQRSNVLAKAAALEPHLRQRIWPPMTYMLIPSVLESADATIAALAACPVADAEVLAALEHLVQLRRDFRRER